MDASLQVQGSIHDGNSIIYEPMSRKLGTDHSAGLVFLLIAGGMTDGMAKIYEELGVGALKNHFLLYTFIVAFAMCVAVCLLKKQGLTKADLGFGLLIGIPNYGSALFLLRSLSSIPAMIAYPTYSVASIVLVTLMGVMVFKEKLSHRQCVSMMIIFAALRRSLARASVSTRVRMTTCISTMVLRTSSSSMRRKDAMRCFSRMTHTVPACAWMVSRLIIARQSSR